MSNIGSDFNPSMNKKTNFSVIFVIDPDINSPSTILTFESWLFNRFSNSFITGFDKSFYISINYSVFYPLLVLFF